LHSWPPDARHDAESGAEHVGCGSQQADTPEQEHTLSAFLVTVHSNMAQAYFKLANFPKAVELASRVLAVVARNVKALSLFRRGTALVHLRHLSDAIGDVSLAAQLAPQDVFRHSPSMPMHLTIHTRCVSLELLLADHVILLNSVR
jgi:hypothetical protein